MKRNIKAIYRPRIIARIPIRNLSPTLLIVNGAKVNKSSNTDHSFLLKIALIGGTSKVDLNTTLANGVDGIRNRNQPHLTNNNLAMDRKNIKPVTSMALAVLR